MNSYTYTISLRVWHPIESLESQYEQISKIPNIFMGKLHIVGTLRTGPKGNILGGTNRHSFFTCTLQEEWISKDVEELHISLKKFIEKLIPYENTIKEISNTGGRLEFFIGLGIDGNTGMSLQPELLAKLANLKIELGFDMYPESDWRE